MVDAVVRYTGDRAWTEYRLRDGSAERWLLVAPEATSLLEPAAGEVTLDDENGAATVGDRRYRSRADGQARQ